jgi:uncharacterized protein (DUF58 family)
MTSAGVWLAALAAVFGAVGAWERYPGLVAVASGYALAVIVAALAVVRRDALKVTLDVPTPLTRGDRMTITATVTSGRRRSAGPLAVRGELDVPAIPVPALRRAETVTVSREVGAALRGSWRVGPVAAVRRDQLGLLTRAGEVSDHVSVMVWPRRHPVVPLAWSRRSWAGSTARARPRPGLAEYEALREYVAGDDLRRVHWPSSARTGTLQVLTYVDPAIPALQMLLDARGTSYPPGPTGDAAFEDAVEAAASVAEAYLACGLPARVRATHGVAWSAHGRQGARDDLLNQLALLKVTEPGPRAGIRAGDATTRAGSVAAGSDRGASALRDAAHSLGRAEAAHEAGALLLLVTGPLGSDVPAVARDHRAGPTLIIRTGAPASVTRLDPTGAWTGIDLLRAADLPRQWRQVDELTARGGR